METKDMIRELRTKKGLSQDELAEKVFVTRQAVSRWENGETTPNTETLKLLSKLFDVSINTLLGSPRELICQCCGMPLEDSSISKEPDGFFNEEYCKWCYADGEYMYHDMDDLIDVCVGHMANDQFTPEQVRAYMKDMLPKLDYWKRYTNLAGAEKFAEFKQQLIDEINALHVEGMPKVEKLNALVADTSILSTDSPTGSSLSFWTMARPIWEISWNVNSAETGASESLPTWISFWSAPTKKTAKIPNWWFTRNDRTQSCRP